MGCSESKINNLRPVNRYDERKTFMKEAVSAHATFVSAHFAYATALENTGIALYDYAQSEVVSIDERQRHLPPVMENDGILVWDFFLELMEVDYKGSRIEKPARKVEGGNGGCGKVAEDGGEWSPPSLEVFSELHDGFIKASRCGYNQGKIKGSTRVGKVKVKMEFPCKEKESHSTLLNKMLEWEKKLYDQVKSSDMMKHEYQKKVAVLNKLTNRGASGHRLERAQATVNQLHRKCIVEMQSIDSTVAEVNRLRDEELHPQLVQIIEEMGEMWKKMRKQHEHQLKIVRGLCNTKISQLPKDSSENNLKNIERIYLHVSICRSEIEKLIRHQKEYVKSLNNWLKLNLISIDNNVNLQNPKIKSLLRTWNDELDKLPEDDAKNAINTFAPVIDRIVQYHLKEMEMKQRCEEIRREITRKTRRFEEWCDKQMLKRIPCEELDADVMDDMGVMAEQQVVVEVLKRRLEVEEEAYRRYRVQVEDKSVMDLKIALPELFTAMSEFSKACSHMYENLKGVV